MTVFIIIDGRTLKLLIVPLSATIVVEQSISVMCSVILNYRIYFEKDNKLVGIDVTL